MRKQPLILALMCLCAVFASQTRASMRFPSVEDTTSRANVSVRKLLMKADSLRLLYEFGKASDLCAQAASADKDSAFTASIEQASLLAHNGLKMLDFCSRPVVVAKEKFALSDFYLYYPLKDNAWRPVPNQLDSLGSGIFPGAMYIPSDAGTLYYSATDEDGIRNIYETERKDTVWTAPKLVNEQLTSSSDEIFPMLSPDGKSLYFSSKGLYGMGGYDLYESKWNPETGDWDIPVNMGFPYSSPFDDYLFVNTPDGRYSMFASNRETSRDSVCIYVLEYDSMPIRKSITDIRELRRLAALSPVNDPSRVDNASAVSGSISDNADTRRYSQMMTKVRSLRDSISSFNRILDNVRDKYATAPESEKEALAASILERELALPALQDSLSGAVSALQRIEMEFLASGVVIDADRIKAEADREVVGQTSGYAFSRTAMGPAPQLRIKALKKAFDYSFKVLPEGQFAEDNALPSGLVYQIQIFSMGTKATVKHLKGLSPVFSRTAGGRNVYYAGLFRKYNDVLSNLNKVKKAGFRTAFIVAFNDGKTVSVPKARQIEKTILTLYQIRVFPLDGLALSSAEMSAIRTATQADLSKVIEAGTLSFLIGPYDDKTEADGIVSTLKNAGIEKVSVEEVPREK